MDRIQVAQTFLDRCSPSCYVEIGVRRGYSLSRVRASCKIAVDPAMRLRGWRRHRTERGAGVTHYFQTTSDEFFAEQAVLLDQTGISVVLVDGLHTYEQALRDVENSLRHLHDDGAIVLHDCNPTTEAMACRASSYRDFLQQTWPGSIVRRAWCGDVWKAIVHLRSTRPDLEVTVLDCDFGVGIVRRAGGRTTLRHSVDEIRTMTYGDLQRHRRELLNLRPPDHLGTLLS